MKDNYSKPMLASYSVIKALTDSNEYKNSYEILADFIRYIVVDRRWHEFSITDVSNELQMEFGFDNIPLPAIKTSLRQITEFKKNGENYVLPRNVSVKTDAFQRIKHVSSMQSQSITEKLKDYVGLQHPQGINLETLEKAFIKYLLDDTATIDQKYSDVISKFILSHDGEDDFKNQITRIREGSILYCGLAYNISELGSLTENLTLYLDTEVLFNIAGYNGVMYQKVAEDFLNQIKAANAKKKKIKLRFFREVKLEIESFFNSAESIICGHEGLITNTAMKSILNGCSTIGDIRDKESDFFYKLKMQYEIIPDEKESYYTEADYPYNIEAIPDGYPEDEKSFEAVRFISHINKLRKGETSRDYISSGYLLVTETRRIQEFSNIMQKEKNDCGFALPTSMITNILWYKLGSGFSKKEYPLNTDVSYKARGILSGEISSNIVRLFEETKEQYKKGLLDSNQVAGRIVLMRDKNQTPEGITADSIDELLDFTPGYIEKYEEGIKQNQVRLKEKEEIIERLKTSQLKEEEQNSRLAIDLAKAIEERDISKAKIDEQNQTIQKQNKELEQFHNAENKRNVRISRWKRAGKFLLGVLIIAFIILFAVKCITKVLEYVSPQTSNSIQLLLGIIGFVVFLWTSFKGLWVRIYGKKDDIEENSNNKKSDM